MKIVRKRRCRQYPRPDATTREIKRRLKAGVIRVAVRHLDQVVGLASRSTGEAEGARSCSSHHLGGADKLGAKFTDGGYSTKYYCTMGLSSASSSQHGQDVLGLTSTSRGPRVHEKVVWRLTRRRANIIWWPLRTVLGLWREPCVILWRRCQASSMSTVLCNPGKYLVKEALPDSVGTR